MSDSRIYIPEVAGHQRRRQKLIHFTHSSTKAAGVMLLAAIVALVVANTAAYEPFVGFWHTHVGVYFGGRTFDMSLAHVINDVLMAVFFLLVGLEVKYEVTVGELTNIRQALLPIMAAVGGVLAPIGIYLLFNAGNAETADAWGVPTATDIAFALGILALLGNRVPAGVRVFLSTLAVADDIIAILVIAIFYGQTPELGWLAAAGVVLLALIAMNKGHVFSIAPYILMGGVLWYCVYMSGVHSTIAGVLLAFTIPSGSHVNLRTFAAWSGDKVQEARESFDPEKPVLGQAEYMEKVQHLSTVAKQVVPPATRIEHKLYPWVYFAILPLFALTNADVSFTGLDVGALFASPVFFGVFFGLVVGKPLGIMLMSLIVVKTKLASLPENVNWLHMLGASILGGVGFTMAIFVANLAFTDETLIATAKLGILLASLVAGVLGFVFLLVQAKAAQRKGVAFVETADDEEALPVAAQESARDGRETLAEAQRADS
jgi:Na+:H+ antiporter, NhaA family